MIRTLAQSELEDFPALEWSDIAPRISPETRAALDQVLESQDGGRLSREQCLLLANAEGDDLLGLLLAADTLRQMGYEKVSSLAGGFRGWAEAGGDVDG